MPPKSEVNVLVRERTLLRSSVTKGSNRIQEILSKETLSEQDQIDLRSQWDVVNSRFQDLKVKDGEIRAILISDDGTTDEALELEQEKVDEYARNFYKTKNNVDRVLSEDVARSEHSRCRDVDVHSSASGVSVVTSAKVKCNLPMLKLREFGGDLNEWLPFWSQFEKIDQDPSLTPSDKLGYLTMCMRVGSPARDLVESYPASAAIYPEVVTALTDRFGRADLLTEFYIRELLKIILHNVKSKMDIRTLYDKLQCHLRNLETLGVTSENCASILMPLVSSCLPEDILLVWERSSVHLPNRTSKDYLNNLLSFLKAEVEGSQKMEMARSGFGFSETPKNVLRRKEFKQNIPSEVVPTAAALVSTKESKFTPCIFCSELSHQSEDCRKAQHMSLSDKKEIVLKKRACYCCLKIGHRAVRCRKRPKCGKCGKGHFDLMCSDSGGSQNDIKGKTTQSLTSSCQSSVLFQTLVVKVKDNNSNDWKYAKLLLDTGSQQSYMLESTASTLGYRPTGSEVMQHAVFGGSVTKPVEHKVYKIVLCNLDDTYECNFDVFGQDQICSSIPSVPSGPWIQELNQKHIQLSDLEHPSAEIEILVGVDVVGKLYTGRRMELKCGLIAMETLLGWTLSGKVPGLRDRESSSVAAIVTSLYAKDACISDLWALDVIGIKDPTEKVEKSEIEKATLDHFLSTVKVNNEERFEVHLPFINDHPSLPSNYYLSKKRLDNTIRKLNNDGYYNEYQEVLDDWEKKGVIEKVSEEQIHSATHYLPHRHVIKIGSTTPVRPVFDASAHEMNQPSLNECLEKGPNFIEKIPACLARFRSKEVAVSGDVEKAFLQISVTEKDRDFLRFTWQTKDGQETVYRHCRVVFGVASSPFLLEACIKLHLENTLTLCKEDKSCYPTKFVEMLEQSFYVDNCLTSLDSLEEAQEFMQVASSIMIERKFVLRGWEVSGEKASKPTNVLGLLWNKEQDCLSISNESLLKMDLEKITKKVMLSAAHRIFDPIGIVSSYVLVPKLLLQQTWEKGLSWNVEVDEDIRNKFRQWMAEVPLLSEVKIPRCVFGANTSMDSLSLHVFSDASKFAYAAAVFVRIGNESEVTVHLLAAKARVAPTSKAKKGMTIPRLELLAASIATRLCKTVVEDYKLSEVRTIFWTDATTVLAWIKNNEPWNSFVMNRVKEIRALSVNCEWRHVPGTMNPADIPSRGSTLKKLLQCTWWEGPEWLKGSPDSWPQQEEVVDENEVMKERKKTVVSATTMTDTLDDWYYHKFSSFKKIVRMVAWLLRFCSNCTLKEKRIRGELTMDEYKSAEKRIFLLVQREKFSGVADAKLSTLVPIVDESGLIRIMTKVSNLPDNRDFCQPIVLPKPDHPVVERLIFDVHKENCHAGPQILTSILRKEYWILGGRRSIRSVLNSCTKCKRYTTKKLEVAPTPLPESRVRDAKIFEVTGVDLAGPLYIKGDDKSTKKVWVCIFTCAVYRAVRLELVSSLSTDSFLQAFRRFCSKQGRPQIVYSDNGTNFVGFEATSNKLDWNAIACYSAAKKIDWRFNPPSSPWWGGWWERLIGILKGLLRRVLGRSFISYEEMMTLLCDCESVINARPLTYMSDTGSDLAVLTPGMFLYELDEIGVPEYDLVDSGDLRNRFKHRRDLKKQLRERFKLEYLGQLQLVSNKKNEHDAKIGDVVLVGDDNSKRIDWPVGRIIQLIHGADGHVRVVKLRTRSGVLTRPIQRIYPLEIQSSFRDELLVTLPKSQSDVQDVGSNPPSIVDLELNSDIDTQSTGNLSPIKGLDGSKVTTRRGRNVKRPTKLDL